MREGNHEPLISLQTYQRIQDRLNGTHRLPNRRNLNEDFPLRGFVVCDHCDSPLTACWSKGEYRRYAYYLCPKRGCEAYGKSIRRDVMEAEFETLLKSVRPTESLFKVARAMFDDLWKRRIGGLSGERKELTARLAKLDKDASQLLDRIVQTTVPSVVAAYEDRIGQIEREKLVLKDKIAGLGSVPRSFETTLRTALSFLANPWNLWSTGRLEERRAVLKLTFADNLRYVRGRGLRTANLSLPFKALGQISGEKREMARCTG